MCRVLAPGGRLAVLEFSLPSRRIIRFLYLLYFRRVLPLLGGLISGDYDAYRYLNRSVESFPYGQAFCGIIAASGFDNVAACPLTCGVATLYTGEKARV
jgi:demethylmenaquinone methyltransferase/2-methoxy-6-polyprenyl-1,4-benzoquinol methylase